MNDKNEFIQSFGYTEMYEWSDFASVVNRLGIFVQFDNNNPGKIIPYEDGEILGVTTINSTVISDNPDKWRLANLCNEVGDIYLQKEKLAVGQKVYDEVLELNYIVTRPWEHFITIPNQTYDPNEQYVPRTNRPEWVKVNLIGKCIVRDNGECKAGEYCRPYYGRLKQKFGTVVPVTPDYDGPKYYVLSRMTDQTIMILFR